MPTPSARADLAALTHERVMRGLADLLTNGEPDVTFRALAQASGVPERTIYRRYATKEAVLGAFWTWLNARLGLPEPPTTPEQLVAQVPEMFAAFDAGEPLVRAMLHDRHGRATRLANAQARRARLTGGLADVLAPLDAGQKKRLLAGVQVLMSAAGWETMKDYWGLTSAEAAEAAQWAIGALLAEARAAAPNPDPTPGQDAQ